MGSMGWEDGWEGALDGGALCHVGMASLWYIHGILMGLDGFGWISVLI